MNKRKTGEYFEEAAASYLIKNNIDIIDRNVYCKSIGELDIVGIDRGSQFGDTLVFFEVKYRKNDTFGRAEYAISKDKIKKIRRCAEFYINYKRIDMLIRFDVIAINGEDIKWYKNAFS